MKALAPAFWSSHVLLYMVVTLSLAKSLVNGDSSSCIPGILKVGNQISGIFAGESVILQCPVRLCDPELPNVTWCKVNGQQCDPVRTGDGINLKMEEQRKDSALYIMTFESVHINDTGYYQCKAIIKDQHVVGSTVQLVISGKSETQNVTAINTTETGITTKGSDTVQTFTSLLYIVSSLGGVCVLIIIVSLLIYCQKHLKAKHSSSSHDPAPTEELQFVAMSGSLKNGPKQSQGGTLKDVDQTAITVEVTYDNAHLGYKSTPMNNSSPKEEDSIVYADLNYNSKKTIFQFEDDHEVEYATVHLNESREK
ncbi:B- and T-lymphocyte attenuator-like isoform 1-T1 [Anomaloglossus baeobatrachus]|uniref:B- and T-lymphocyte attenuator-like n=1 Tax=Anomaloglossus baeobatrachus TaxID=238106 RepID=UPI003F4FC0A5